MLGAHWFLGASLVMLYCHWELGHKQDNELIVFVLRGYVSLWTALAVVFVVWMVKFVELDMFFFTMVRKCYLQTTYCEWDILIWIQAIYQPRTKKLIEITNLSLSFLLLITSLIAYIDVQLWRSSHTVKLNLSFVKWCPYLLVHSFFFFFLTFF